MPILPDTSYLRKKRQPRGGSLYAPFRSELLSSEQQCQRAKALAESHQISKHRCSNQLLDRLAINERDLRAFNQSTRTVDLARRITPAANWLLDNHYHIEDQIQIARQHLPKGYSRELPCLANGTGKGLPRVYDIVVQLISHVDAQIESGELSAFIDSYQSVTSLKLGELWAIPIMLRLGLIENLQRISMRLLRAREDRDVADSWVERLQAVAETAPSQLVVVVADMAKSNPPRSSAFVAEFCQRLSVHSPMLNLAQSWLQHRLMEDGLSMERMIDQETQSQAADQVSVSHSIASLRLLSATNWREFVESLSKVEQILRLDPAGFYSSMDFTTRDQYRHIVEEVSRCGPLSEEEVARLVVEHSEVAAAKNGYADRSAHVGYHLIDRGACALARSAKARGGLRSKTDRFLRRFPLPIYMGLISGVSLLITLAVLYRVFRNGIPIWAIGILGLALLICASQFSVTMVNWLISLWVTPRLLPRLDFASGLPAQCRTMVVVPTMLNDTAGITQLIETLEIHYLANRDEHLHFALLTDFCDANQENLEGDEALIRQAVDGVKMLNRKYPSLAGGRFFLFHRPRRWNPIDSVWMGYERKRGKLAELNGLLRGESKNCFSVIIGGSLNLPDVRYVITLDTDTQLPRDAAVRLIGAMAHPLNRPIIDPHSGIVTDGYGILQPRVGVSLPSARRSWFARLFTSEVGIDPYTRAAADLYQDLFSQGSFIGKGIYEVDAFRRALDGRFPENAILSHDLLESCYARSALISDVEFYEDYPSRYDVDVERRHRWMRGDWQIFRWLLPSIRAEESKVVSNPLSGISRWKIFDNLRRSLLPAAMMLFLLGPCLLAPRMVPWFVLLIAGVLLLPTFCGAAMGILRKPSGLPWRMHLQDVSQSSLRQLAQTLIMLVFLPYDAYVSLDAIFRTLYRLFVTRKSLLQWKTSGESEMGKRHGVLGAFRKMWIAPAVALLCGAALGFIAHQGNWAIYPFLCLWLFSPLIAWLISQPIEKAVHELNQAQLEFLQVIARKTWHFFEVFVTAKENWLPPDNYQENPLPVVASRTSPTNMGLALLANLAARDFGYISIQGLILRTQDALETMCKLERYRGHFYNWYDTRTLAVLAPPYVSSVDSGNLAGHLFTLGAGLREQSDSPMFYSTMLSGMGDTVSVLLEFLPDSEPLTTLATELAFPPTGLRSVLKTLEKAKVLIASARMAPEVQSADLAGWFQSLSDQCHDQVTDLMQLAPWTCVQQTRVGNRFESDLLILDQGPSLRTVTEFSVSLCSSISEACDRLQVSGSVLKNEIAYLSELLNCVREGAANAKQRLDALESLAVKCDELGTMDFGCLFDPARDLFSIGLNVTDRKLDQSYYDLLASEARLCSYVAVALGQVPQDHWFTLGRLLVVSRGLPVLASWSGSMFEYLMPLLVMPSYENTLLEHTCRAAVRQQINYGAFHDVPWGISESGYNRIDAQLNYQYRAFGVPGLGLKRGLSDDLVVAPYASMMALMVEPLAGCENLQRLAADGRTGNYGFYEAVDYTSSRMPPEKLSVTIFSFMVHHQGMGLLGLTHLLKDRPMQRRFMACPLLKAADLLLQERVPKTAASVVSADLALELGPKHDPDGECVMRIFTNPSSAVPEVHLLSNGRYHVMVSSAGGGYSRWRDLAITRWREDATCDHWGTFIYVRDLGSGDFISTGYQPTQNPGEGYEAIFTQARAEFRQRHSKLEIHTEICVSPEDDVELRRVTITNRSPFERLVEVTSYAEVVLAAAASDAAHPAFSNLFVQTEFIPSSSAVLCSRRARSEAEKPPWFMHVMIASGADGSEVSCETDRMRFVGRGGSLAHPAVMNEKGVLSNTVGSVLDPVVSLRRTLRLLPFATGTIELVFGMSESRTEALSCIEKYQSSRMVDRAFDLAWTHSQVTLHRINASEGEAQLFDRLAGPLIYADYARRATSDILFKNRRGQNGLWSHGISGDLPIVLLHISDLAKIDIARQLVRAHSYWRMKGLVVDLVIIYEEVSTYRQSLQEELVGLAGTGIESQLLDRPGGVFIRRLEQVPYDDLILIQAVARVILDDEHGSLMEQFEHRKVSGPKMPVLVPNQLERVDVDKGIVSRDLIFSNGYGGFTRDGHEYVITLKKGEATPAPWVNVLANANFGTLVSESGSGYTWSENAHEFRLTPWSNDPVLDPVGEALYIRDEHTGQFWSPTPSPARGLSAYVIRHGFGYSVFEHTENGIASELWVYVAMDSAVKFSVLKLRNLSGGNRRLSVTSYVEWVLGDLREKSLLHVQTEEDAKTGALFARNHGNTEFLGRIVFLDVNETSRSLTGDREEFIGRNGSLARPAAMKRLGLSGKVGAGLDPCGAIQVVVDLSVGQEREVVFRLGVGQDLADTRNLVGRYRRVDACRGALEGVWSYWSRTLCGVHVETPDEAVNVMANGWLLYQTLSSRVWGRTGFYQSGGAYGFRDQLQDVMALVHSQPGLVREHLLRAASRQFKEGDAQHWWHPPSGRGVRTHSSDDYLWLPYAVCHYVSCVADTGILDVSVDFLEARRVKVGEEAYYDLPNRAEANATLYEHCVRAIEHALRFGEHGLPLMGSGDWNDGMNLVGKDGRGESVWLAFFLYDVLSRFSELSRLRGDSVFADSCLTNAVQLKENIELHGWDGKWYRRAYFDNGEVLGSARNEECQIDSLPQSWSIISGAGQPERTRLAMAEVDGRLVRREAGLIQLFDPPFDSSALNPGYIKGYMPGVRENGGQYTHAGIWVAMAFAQIGDGERAWELFNLLNPVHHGDSPERIAIYKVEPYVIAADVYGVAPHMGRGGWTWYTGSASWMYRLLVETLLGIHLEGDNLRLAPHLPESWPGYKIHYRFRQTVYHISVSRRQPHSEAIRELKLDGIPMSGDAFPLADDHQEHQVEMSIS